MNKKYDNLVGKTPEQITHYFGNRKPTVNEAIWAYELQSNWYGRKKMLYLFFENDSVSLVIFKHTYTKKI